VFSWTPVHPICFANGAFDQGRGGKVSPRTIVSVDSATLCDILPWDRIRFVSRPYATLSNQQAHATIRAERRAFCCFFFIDCSRRAQASGRVRYSASSLCCPGQLCGRRLLGGARERRTNEHASRSGTVVTACPPPFAGSPLTVPTFGTLDSTTREPEFRPRHPVFEGISDGG
jgi:hypothetical protein